MFRLHRRFRLGFRVWRPWVRRLLTMRVAAALVALVIVCGGVAAILLYATRVSAAYTCTGGGDHGGAAWDPATDCPGGVAGVHTNISTLSIGSGETATVQAYNGAGFGSVDISASTISIVSTLTATGKGYLGGISSGNGGGPGGGAGSATVNAGGGGFGSAGFTPPSGVAGGAVNGTALNPSGLGSGGGSKTTSAGGAGGGSIKLTATGTMTNSGAIVANGAAAVADGAGGGAGGSIIITAAILTGNGSTAANGGAGFNHGGGGAGGRIKYTYSSSNSLGGSFTATGGTSLDGTAGSGTPVIYDSTNNDLYINTTQTWYANPSIDGSSFTFRNVTVQFNSVWTLQGYNTNNSDGAGQIFNVTNFTVNAGSTVTANGTGYPGGTASGNGSGPGGGTGSATLAAGGAGFGGVGQTGTSGGVAGGPAVGSALNPSGLGSGGGSNNGGTGGAGGGSIKIVATGTVTNSGSITANGAAGVAGTNSGGGAGGSIIITAAILTGNGSTTANGGAGASSGGGGSGGRIKYTYSSSNSLGGSFTAIGGSSGGGGSATNGTPVVYDSTNNDLYINTTQTWYANPSIDGSSFTFRNVTVQFTATWTLVGYNTTNSDGVGQIFTVTNFTIANGSTVTANGMGYLGGAGSGNGSGPGGGSGTATANGAGGGAFGNNGGNGSAGGGAGGPVNGGALNPSGLGSGGGAQNGNTGGAGGGSIKITASGTLTVSGTLATSGQAGISGNAGGGSGGSILITMATLTGAGSIASNGGAGAGSGGGGSGGRIKISYSSSVSGYTGSVSATGGTSSSQAGGFGTYILYNSPNNDVVINTNQTWFANPAIDGSSPMSFHSITVQNTSTLTLNGYNTTNGDGVGFTFNVVNFTVATGSVLTGNGLGYAGGTGSANGSGAGGGTGTATANGAGGAAYGASAGNGNTGIAGGAAYGNNLAPTDLGSGGGAQNGVAGGAGGSAIRIIASGTVTISGSLTMNGANATGASAGGGSGGSIMLTVGTLTGNGTLTANGGNGITNGGGGSGGRIAVFFQSSNTWTGTSLVSGSAAVGGTGSHAGSNGTVSITHHAFIDRSITMSSSASAATGVTYEVVINPAATTTVGGIVVDICDDSPMMSASCTYPANFDWGGATPSITVVSGMGSGWTASGVQGGAGAGKSQVVKLSNATPQSVTAGTNMDFKITSATNPNTSNHSFYARVITFNTSGNMNSEYTVSGATRSGNLTDSLDTGGFALSTGNGGISLQFTVPETLTFCTSGSTITGTCGGLTTPSITIGHASGSTTLIDTTAVDAASIYTQLSSNAQGGVIIRMKDTTSTACGGLSINNGVSCGIPAATTVSLTPVLLVAGTAKFGMCVVPGSGITADAPYNGSSPGTVACANTATPNANTSYGLDDSTANNNVIGTFGSAIYHTTVAQPINQAASILNFAATASASSPAGVYNVGFSLIATSTF